MIDIKDLFAGASGTDLAAHAPDVGGTWSKTNTGNAALTGTGRVRANSAGTNVEYHLSTVVSTASYTVAGTIYFGTTLTNAGIIFRSQRVALGENSFYQLRTDATAGLQLIRIRNSAADWVRTAALPSSASGTSMPVLIQSDASGRIQVYLNGSVTPTIDYTDPNTPAYANPGLVGVAFYNGGSTANGAATEIGNLVANDSNNVAPGAPTITLSNIGGDVINVPSPATAGTGTLTGYKLYAGSTSGGESATAVATLVGTSGSFPAQPTAGPGTRKFYTVKAYDDAGLLSAASNEVFSATTALSASGVLYSYAVTAVYKTGGQSLAFRVLDPIGAVLASGSTVEVSRGQYCADLTLDTAWRGAIVVDAPASEVGQAFAIPDKTGFGLAPAERTAISNTVQAGIMDDTDGTAVEQALANKIAATDLQLGSITVQGIAQAARAEIDNNSSKLAAMAADQVALASAVAALPVPDNASINAIRSKTENLPAQPASQADVLGISGGASAAEIWSYGDRRTTVAPVTTQPTLLMRHRQIVRGDTYGGNGRAFLSQVSDGGEWPTDLSAFTWTCTMTKDPANALEGTGMLTVVADVVTPTGDSRALSISLTAEQTAALAPARYAYAIKGIAGEVVWSPETGDLDAL